MFDVRATVPNHAVALTFDDGPHAMGTPRILEILGRESVPATFFLAGEQVDADPALAAHVEAAGHTIGVHCHQHRSLFWRTPSQVKDDLARAAASIERATGSESRAYRPPFGHLTTPSLAYARKHGWQTFLWRREGHDWESRATGRSITDRILRRLQPGDVILLHDSDAYSTPLSWQATAAALPRLIEAIRERGIAFVALSSGETDARRVEA
jgi:peptidoglycan-N-acetylglucosamine deacetylase